MALEINLNEKRKEKGKREKPYLLLGGLEAHPRRPTPSLSSLMGRRSRARFLPFYLALAWAGPGAAAAVRFLSLASLTSGPRMFIV
jgi:hypothetical protein